MVKVFLLTIDALRYDLVEGDDVPTPNIDRLLECSHVYTRAFSNGCGTPTAFPAILYSSKNNSIRRAPDNEKSIADHFQSMGFRTIGITANPYTSSYYGYDKGFDRFIDFVKPTGEKEEDSLLFKAGRKIVHIVEPIYKALTAWRAKHNLPYERAETLNKELLTHITPGENEFIWVHYMDMHAPYSPPKEYGEKYCPQAFAKRGRLTNELYAENVSSISQKQLWELYKTELRYLDDQVGALLERIKNLDEKTYIVFTSDHGEEFGENGTYQHKQYFNINIHIPLAFYLPQDEGSHHNKLASHLDILPTLLSRFTDTEIGDGIDLLKEKRDYLIITPENADIVITDKWKLLKSEENYLFDISESTIEDTNLYDEHPDVVDKLEKYLPNSREFSEDIDI